MPTRPILKEASDPAAGSSVIYGAPDIITPMQVLKGTNTNYKLQPDIIDGNPEYDGSPMVRLTGDEVVGGPESSLYLLSSTSSAISGTALTNNGTITFTQVSDNNKYLNEQNVSVLNGTSQYFSLATEASVEVGTGSFEASIWFKCNGSTDRAMFGYGDEAASEQNFSLYINSSGKLEGFIDDGTQTVTMTDPVANRWNNNKWHVGTLVWDSTLKTGHIFVDGILLASSTNASLTATLNNAGTNLIIGAKTNTSVQKFFSGNLALFRLNKNLSFQSPILDTQHIRERFTVGTWAIAANGSARLNSTLANSTTANNDYVNWVIDVEDGEYDCMISYNKNTTFGIFDLLVDGSVIVSQVDGYNGSATYNNTSKTNNIRLSKGKHILKLRVNGKNASSSSYAVGINYILLVKRSGHELGGLTRFLLLGDDINEVSTLPNATTTFSNSVYLNSYFYNQSGSVDGMYTQGVIYIKGGLYKISTVYATTSAAGRLDLDFGDVEVLDLLDTYSAGTTYNVVTTRLVRLPQGAVTVRLAVNGKNASSSSYDINLIQIRGERLYD